MGVSRQMAASLAGAAVLAVVVPGTIGYTSARMSAIERTRLEVLALRAQPHQIVHTVAAPCLAAPPERQERRRVVPVKDRVATRRNAPANQVSSGNEERSAQRRRKVRRAPTAEDADGHAVRKGQKARTKKNKPVVRPRKPSKNRTGDKAEQPIETRKAPRWPERRASTDDNPSAAYRPAR